MQHDFILLDRSGSMAGPNWVESINGINSYVQKLAADNIDTGVTLVAFDLDVQTPTFMTMRDRITPKTWKPVKPTEAEPRGMTPLNDAIAKIVSLAEGGGYDKVAIIIVTDGQENASKEYTHAQAKALLDRCRAKDWVVIYIGADFDNVRQAQSYGAVGGQHVNSTTGNMRSTYTVLGSKRGLYASGAVGQSANTMDFMEAEVAAAAVDAYAQGAVGHVSSSPMFSGANGPPSAPVDPVPSDPTPDNSQPGSAAPDDDAASAPASASE